MLIQLMRGWFRIEPIYLVIMIVGMGINQIFGKV